MRCRYLSDIYFNNFALFKKFPLFKILKCFVGTYSFSLSFYFRAEWLMSVNGAFKQGFPVVTIYTNLGEDAVIHGLEETEVETVVTSHELLPKFKKILKDKKDKVFIIGLQQDIARLS